MQPIVSELCCSPSQAEDQNEKMKDLQGNVNKQQHLQLGGTTWEQIIHQRGKIQGADCGSIPQELSGITPLPQNPLLPTRSQHYFDV